MMGISPFKNKIITQGPRHDIAFLSGLLPSQSIIKALCVFIPKAMSLNNREHLDKELVPNDSKLRHLFEEKDDHQNKTHISQHNITTPVGNIQISSISKSYG